MLVVSLAAQAALFEDEEARRAILDLRQRVEQMRTQYEQRLNDENAQLRRSLLDLQTQIETMRGELPGRQDSARSSPAASQSCNSVSRRSTSA